MDSVMEMAFEMLEPVGESFSTGEYTKLWYSQKFKDTRKMINLGKKELRAGNNTQAKKNFIQAKKNLSEIEKAASKIDDDGFWDWVFQILVLGILVKVLLHVGYQSKNSINRSACLAYIDKANGELDRLIQTC